MSERVPCVCMFVLKFFATQKSITTLPVFDAGKKVQHVGTYRFIFLLWNRRIRLYVFPPEQGPSAKQLSDIRYKKKYKIKTLSVSRISRSVVFFLFFCLRFLGRVKKNVFELVWCLCWALCVWVSARVVVGCPMQACRSVRVAVSYLPSNSSGSRSLCLRFSCSSPWTQFLYRSHIDACVVTLKKKSNHLMWRKNLRKEKINTEE